ncbi:NAD(P)H-binding protein [Streptomyces sp. NPDC006446]|uniref:SDR family oxidoreductase n=1 Tax=Streptomyces sp. NPDC006446 TaxID=3154301 RepID=UPI0033ADA9EA
MLLVTGVTGNIGRALTRELDATGAKSRLLVRDHAHAHAARLPERAERVVGDLEEPSTPGPAFAGVGKLFLLTQGIGIDRTAATTAGLIEAMEGENDAVGDEPPASWHPAHPPQPQQPGS